MIFVKREDWSNVKAANKAKYSGSIKGAVVHWPGMNFNIQTQQDEINLLNGILRVHKAGVYNDIAYSFAVGRFGHVYELRGGEFQSGAHSPLNGSHEAYLFLCSIAESAPKSMLDTGREFILLRRSQGVGSDLRAHSQVKSTACPGGVLKQFVKEFAGGGSTPSPVKPPAVSQPKYNGKVSKRGSKGVQVGHIQRRLNERGWKYRGRPLAVDNNFGAITEQVVRWFQTEKRLQVDGIVGPATWNALFRTDNL